MRLPVVMRQSAVFVWVPFIMLLALDGNSGARDQFPGTWELIAIDEVALETSLSERTYIDEHIWMESRTIATVLEVYAEGDFREVRTLTNMVGMSGDWLRREGHHVPDEWLEAGYLVDTTSVEEVRIGDWELEGNRIYLTVSRDQAIAVMMQRLLSNLFPWTRDEAREQAETTFDRLPEFFLRPYTGELEGDRFVAEDLGGREYVFRRST